MCASSRTLSCVVSTNVLKDALDSVSRFCSPELLLTPMVIYMDQPHPHAACPVVSADDMVLPLRGTLTAAPITKLLEGRCSFCFGVTSQTVLSHAASPVLSLVALLENMHERDSLGALLSKISPENTLLSHEALSVLLADIKASREVTSGQVSLLIRFTCDRALLPGCFFHSTKGFSLTLENIDGVSSGPVVSLEAALSLASHVESLFPSVFPDASDALAAALSLID